jgi:glycosyltransferase involved in cell wall biosynthesis
MDVVSVIIPFYNSGALLHQTMQSLLRQTYPFLEIILVDDGSTDNSYQIALQYKSDNVLLLRQANAGAAAARNTGLINANGSFIQFLDAGDLLSEQKIEAQVNVLKEAKNKVAVCQYKQFTDVEELKRDDYPNQSQFIYSTTDTQDFLVRLWGGYGQMDFIQTNCWLVPRSVIDISGPWRNYRCPDDDGEFFARVLLASKGIIFVPGVYNYYHINPGGVNHLSKSGDRKHQQNTLLTIQLKHHYLLKKGYHPLINQAIASQYFRYAIDMFPARKVLSAIAYNRYRAFRLSVDVPVLGGPVIELIKHITGWRMARYIRYYFHRFI